MNRNEVIRCGIFWFASNCASIFDVLIRDKNSVCFSTKRMQFLILEIANRPVWLKTKTQHGLIEGTSRIEFLKESDAARGDLCILPGMNET